MRQFAKPAKGGGGGAPAAAPVPVEKPKPTIIEKFNEDNKDNFILGGVPNANKTHNAHREALLPKLEPRFDAYAKKLRDLYLREATIPNAKRYITPIRERLQTDTVDYCLKTQVGVPGVIEARDEFDDLDLLFSW
eukprot:CAMPEP_0176374920 /NCGR_PEP_ID=MMETSP0126-20121128/27125_1 /TAXON_ID=141414 ORGANISM="Strombidinopsis acuminatum, Strain SPMC142" /NCGR_SAMPLE_ID=MMETSP0126 /ASSEMBLY_ACC=CAM_ASM_000229 /LENGTH=134 /DNA_ID=CAMNT_0017735749 /DNA_START=52 /DNA_END=453 /DNA_ORIENTATION=+